MYVIHITQKLHLMQCGRGAAKERGYDPCWLLIHYTLLRASRWRFKVKFNSEQSLIIFFTLAFRNKVNV
jgi:hypothetical protein